MTPFQYVKSELVAGRFGSMTILELCGSFALGDNDWNFLKGPTYTSRCAAEQARSKINDRALKAYWKG